MTLTLVRPLAQTVSPAKFSYSDDVLESAKMLKVHHGVLERIRRGDLFAATIYLAIGKEQEELKEKMIKEVKEWQRSSSTNSTPDEGTPPPP